MSFTNLISKVLEFVNLGKVVVDGGPGVILAVALAIMAASVAELPIFPYTHGPIGLGGSGGKPSAAGEGKSRYEERLGDLVEEIERSREQAVGLLWAKARADADADRLKAEVERLTTEVEDLRTERSRRTKEDVFDDGRLSREIRALETARERTEEDLARALRRQSYLQRLLADEEAEVERRLAEFVAASEERITNLRGLFAYLLDHLIGLALVGWVLGTLLSPMNRALLQFGTRAGLELQRKQPLKAFDAALATKGKKLSGAEQEELEELLGQRSASYFIGRKIISKTEWDEMVASYYRWAEAANNLIIPLTVLGLSLLCLTPPEWPAVVAAGTAVALVLAALGLARRGHFLFVSEANAAADRETEPAERLLKGLLRAVPFAVLIVLAALVAAAFLLHGRDLPSATYAVASGICWLLAFLAWFQGRKAFFRYRRRETDFILGRLVSATLETGEAGAAKSLQEVAERTVSSLKELLEEVKKEREKVQKEILAKLKEWLDSQQGGGGAGE